MDDSPNQSPLEAENWYPEMPEERVEAILDETTKVTSSIGLLQEILDWFDDKIAGYASPAVLSGVSVSTPAEDVKSAVLLSQGMGAEFGSKMLKFRADFAQYLDRKDKADEAVAE